MSSTSNFIAYGVLLSSGETGRGSAFLARLCPSAAALRRFTPFKCKTLRPQHSRYNTLSKSFARPAQLVEQCLCIFQIGGVEAFREPVVDIGEPRTCLFAASLRYEQPGEVGRGTQFPRLGALLTCDLDSALKAILNLSGLVR